MAHQKSVANLIQAIRDNTDEQTTNRFSDALILRAINEAKDRVWSEVRRLRSDYFTTALASNAGSQTILSETYAATGLQVTVGGTTMTLPPDFAELKLLEVITTDYETVRFRHVDFADPEFKRLREITDQTTPSEFIFDIYNERTLIYAPLSNTLLNTRLFYVFKLANLVTGGTLQMPEPLEICVEWFATASVQLGDYAAESAAWEQRAKALLSEFLGADTRQAQDPVFVQPAFGEAWY